MLNFEYNECEKRVSTQPVIMLHKTPTSIAIVVNGESRCVRQGETITGLIRSLELDPERLAIELDRSIVKRKHWASTALAAGAQLEIVQFVGGG